MKWRTGISALWLGLGAGGVIGAELLYGWSSPPIDHPWHLIAWLTLIGWLVAGRRLDRK